MRMVSSELKAVFCWYCLLFVKDRNTSWTKTWYRQLGNLMKSVAEHAMIVNHLRSVVNIVTFGENRLETALDDETWEWNILTQSKCKAEQGHP